MVKPPTAAAADTDDVAAALAPVAPEAVPKAATEAAVRAARKCARLDESKLMGGSVAVLAATDADDAADAADTALLPVVAPVANAHDDEEVDADEDAVDDEGEVPPTGRHSLTV